MPANVIEQPQHFGQCALTPFFQAYHMSWFALKSLSDQMRMQTTWHPHKMSMFQVERPEGTIDRSAFPDSCELMGLVVFTMAWNGLQNHWLGSIIWFCICSHLAFQGRGDTLRGTTAKT